MYFFENLIIGKCNFYAPAWKVDQGHLVIGSSVCPSVRLSVCPSVCPSVRNSVPLTNKVQYIKFVWWYSNHTWTVHLWFPHWHHLFLGVGQNQNVGLRDFCNFSTLLPPGASVFHKHVSSLKKNCKILYIMSLINTIFKMWFWLNLRHHVFGTI